ncbi:MAG: hypothetical protein ACXVZX_16125 [Terriglobales bacterium]
MTRKVIRWTAVCILMMFALLASAQEKQEFLDIEQVQVKPEKRAEFDALTKKMAEANRKNGGDTWLTLESMYGDANVITFISTRNGYGDVEKAMNAFMGAATKAFGGAQAQKLEADWSACVSSMRAELRVRRWDLSSNVPKDATGYAKMVGESRYLRTTRVKVRSGRNEDFEAMVKEVKAARERSAPNNVMLVSQVVVGEEGNIYYLTTLEPTMAAYDSLTPMKKFLSDDAYQKWAKTNAEVVESGYTTIHHFMPEISNAPTEVAAASPEFWNPKPVMAKKAAPPAAPKNAAKKGTK